MGTTRASKAKGTTARKAAVDREDDAAMRKVQSADAIQALSGLARAAAHASKDGGAGAELSLTPSAAAHACERAAAHAAAGAKDGVGYSSDTLVPPLNQAARERKKGVPWTEDEHRLFLLGLQKLGKGDWRGISRHFVQTRTPTQVASHAQKYFIRQNNMNKRKRRSSLFDIVTDPMPGVAGPLGGIAGRPGAGVDHKGLSGLAEAAAAAASQAPAAAAVASQQMQAFGAAPAGFPPFGVPGFAGFPPNMMMPPPPGADGKGVPPYMMLPSPMMPPSGAGNGSAAGAPPQPGMVGFPYFASPWAPWMMGYGGSFPSTSATVPPQALSAAPPTSAAAQANNAANLCRPKASLAKSAKTTDVKVESDENSRNTSPPPAVKAAATAATPLIAATG